MAPLHIQCERAMPEAFNPESPSCAPGFGGSTRE